MLFREYVELLYQAYLEDRGYLQKLRDKIKAEEFHKDQMYDPSFEDWKSIDPRNSDTYHGSRIKFHPNIQDPQKGVYTYEGRRESGERLRVIRECLSRRKENDKYQKQNNREAD